MASQGAESANVQHEAYCWTSHPARQRLGAAVLAVLVIGGFAALCGFATDPWLGLLSAVVLVGSLNRFFLPSRFTMDARGITADYPLRTRTMDWSEIRRFEKDRFGGFLSTRALPSRLDAYRGMHLLFADSRNEAIRQIQNHLAARKFSSEEATARDIKITETLSSGGEACTG